MLIVIAISWVDTDRSVAIAVNAGRYMSIASGDSVKTSASTKAILRDGMKNLLRNPAAPGSGSRRGRDGLE